MKINYSGLIAEEQCMKASSWEANEPVAHINVVQSLIDRLNDAEESNQKLKEDIEKLKNESSELAVKLVEVYQRYDDKPDPNEC